MRRYKNYHKHRETNQEKINRLQTERDHLQNEADLYSETVRDYQEENSELTQLIGYHTSVLFYMEAMARLCKNSVVGDKFRDAMSAYHNSLNNSLGLNVDLRIKV